MYIVMKLFIYIYLLIYYITYDTYSYSYHTQVASYLSKLPNVNMIEGDATDLNSCKRLVKGCDVILALHGPLKPPPLQSLFCLLPESDPKHVNLLTMLLYRI